jgi:hypothetical protein
MKSCSQRWHPSYSEIAVSSFRFDDQVLETGIENSGQAKKHHNAIRRVTTNFKK